MGSFAVIVENFLQLLLLYSNPIELFIVYWTLNINNLEKISKQIKLKQKSDKWALYSDMLFFIFLVQNSANLHYKKIAI